MKKNENKRNHKSRLLLLLLLLLICLCVLGTATYAWFTSNKTVNVSDLNVDVRAVNGLEISADAENWGFVIDKEDLITGYTDAVNQLPTVMTAVSTAGNLTNGKLDMYNGVVVTSCAEGYTASGSVCYKSEEADKTTNGDGTVSYSCANHPGYTLSGDACYLYGEAFYTLTSTKATEQACYDTKANGATNDSNVAKCKNVGAYFMAFDIFLKVDTESELFLTGNAGVRNTDTNGDSGIKNTTRVAFVVQGNIDTDTYYNGTNEGGVETDGVTLARKLSNNITTDPNSETKEESLILWEPNYDTHTARGIASAAEYYGITGLANSGSSLLSYDGVKSVFTDVSLKETNKTQYPNYFRTLSADIATTATNSNRFSSKITLKAGVTKVRVYFWIEGQDVDTENNASGSSMKLSLEFSID